MTSGFGASSACMWPASSPHSATSAKQRARRTPSAGVRDGLILIGSRELRGGVCVDDDAACGRFASGAGVRIHVVRGTAAQRLELLDELNRGRLCVGARAVRTYGDRF